MNDSLDKLKSLLKLSDELVKRNEFVVAFQHILKIITTIETELIKKIQKNITTSDAQTTQAINDLREMKKEFEKTIQETKTSTETTFARMKMRSLESINEMFNKMRLNDRFNEMMKECEAKMPDTEKMMTEMLAKVPLETPESVRDKLETLKGEEEYAPIKELRAEIEQIKKIPRSGGGGTSAIGVRQAFKYIAHTEQPSGDINGVNTTYTVKNAIWWIAGFTLNGEQIAELPNYTYAGNTITFATALPADYSGKDWEIKYIG